MQDLFLKQAVANHVLPIDDRRSERFDAKIAGTPDLMSGRTSLTVYPGMTGMTENAFINVKNVAFTITAPVELRDARTNGVIIAQAGAFGGWALYMKDGKVHYEYNFFGVERTNIAGRPPLPRPKARDPLRVRAGCSEAGRRGQGRALRGRTEGGGGHIPKTQPYAFSGDEGADVGVDGETAVSNDYKQGDNKFTGKIVKVTIDIAPSQLREEDQKAVHEACRGGRAGARIEVTGIRGSIDRRLCAD